MSRLAALAALALAGLALAGLALGCAGASAAPAIATPAPASAARPAAYPEDDASWGRYHSKRFLLTVPLPDGKAWRIDDHSRPSLFALHEGTSSRLSILKTREDDLMNRKKCEERARELGWVTSKTLTTVEEEVTVGPDAYDSRVWVAIDAAKGGPGLEGHVYLFGAFLRGCLLVHLSTRVPAANDEDVLAARLAVARARIIRGMTLDPPRVTDDATVPRDKPEIRR